ncbi:serum response factor-binding protein 1-like isoform X2 [Mytilus trossulus]|uniref:serum response factor-binding protein 1-like isoform X2 n=1 Tax=Mytilus trossulus TaxID=6551 RepID=UPI003007E17D
MEVHEQRKLDVAKPASTDILSLNNKIIMMRQAVKRAKGQTVQKIIRRVKSLRNKKGTEEEKNKDKRKIERQLEVMYAIKDLKLDKVSKFAIGYDSVLQEITEKPDASSEMIALARLSEHAALKEEVDKFRKDHDDWKSLSEFLLNHIPRRFNKNKYKEIKSKMMTNVNAGNVLVKAYLENKIGKDSELTIEDDSGVSGNASDTELVNKSTEMEKVSQGQTTQVEDESQQELSEVMEEISCQSTNDSEESKKLTEIIKVSPQKTSKVNLEKSPTKFKKSMEEKTHKLTNVKEKSDTSEVIKKQANKEEDSNSNGDNDSLKESENNEISDDQSNAESESNEEDSDIDESESRVVGSDSDESESRVVGSDSDESEISEEDSNNDEQVESENEDHTKIKGEMVVKKLNMNDLVNSKDEDIPDFLVANSQEENISKVRKSKDSFFERGDSDDEDSDDNLPSTHGDSESDDMGEDEKREASRQAISSSFLGALNEVKSKHRPHDESEGQGYGGRWGHFDRRNDSRGRGGFDRRTDSRGRGGFDRRNDSRGRGGFDRRNDSRGRGHFDRRDDSRGRGQNRGYGRDRGFNNYRGRGGQGNFERRGRGNFQGHQNGPRDFQRSDNRGSSYRQNQSYADNKGSSTKTEEKLHPSWEASKKRKEHSTIQAFQGKKIKFDD